MRLLKAEDIGAIELPLQTAAKVDPDDLALDYLRDGLRPNDRRKEIYDAREECYKVVTQALGELDGKLSQATASGDGERSHIHDGSTDDQSAQSPQHVMRLMRWLSIRMMSYSIDTYMIGMSTVVSLNSFSK